MINMNSFRIEKLNSLIRNELARIFHEDVKNPLFEKVTITCVRVTADLSFAAVFYSTFEGDAKGLEKSLNMSSSFFRNILKKRLRIKKIPEIRFKYDESIEYGEHIEMLLKEIAGEKE